MGRTVLSSIIKQTEKYHVTSAEAWPGRSLLWEWLSGDYLRWVELSGGRRVSRCPPWLSIVNNVSAPPLTIIILRVTLITVRLLTMMVHKYFTFCNINTTYIGPRGTHATHKILGSKWNDERSYSGIYSPTTHSLPTGILVDRATSLKILCHRWSFGTTTQCDRLILCHRCIAMVVEPVSNWFADLSSTVCCASLLKSIMVWLNMGNGHCWTENQRF